MIVCTHNNDTMLKKACTGSNVGVGRVPKMIEEFKLDPSVSEANKQAFVFSTKDFGRNKRLIQKFLTNAATKHPDVKIVVIATDAKTEFKEGNGIDKVLIKPTPEIVSKTMSELLGSITAKADIVSAADKVPVGIEQFRPTTLEKNTGALIDEFGTKILDEPEVDTVTVDDTKEVVITDEVEPEKLDIDLTFMEDKREEEEIKLESTSELCERFKNCNKLADIVVAKRELSAAAVLNEVLERNTQYVSVEERLAAIKQKMTAIWADPNITDYEQKMNKIKALAYDKDVIKSEGNTLIEQRTNDIVNTVVDKTLELYRKRLNEIDALMVKLAERPSEGINSTRLQGLADEHANILLELTTMDTEIKDICATIKEVDIDISQNMSVQSTSITGSPLIDARLRARGESVVSDNTLDCISKIMQNCDRASEEFKKASRDIITMIKRLDNLLHISNLKIEALQEVVRILQSNNVEGMVVAKTKLKMALRLFLANEGSGRTVVPLTVSRIKSRENCNVLYIDLTGSNKAIHYGEALHSLDDWMNNRYEKPFCGVTGEAPTTIEGMQRLITAITKAADYYRMINVVLDPKQRELFDLLVADAISVTYLLDTTRTNMNAFKDIISETNYENVAQILILNKCDILVGPVLEELGVMDKFKVQFGTVPNIPAINECSLRGIPPYEVTTVYELFGEVVKIYAES